MDCKMQVSAGQLPPCDSPLPAPSLPCGARPGATVGFPKRVDPFLLLAESWSSCFGRSGPPLAWPPYRKQGGPKTSWLVWRPAVALEVRLPEVPHSHRCPRAWHCAFFPEKTGHQRDWCGAHSQAF